MEHVVFFPAHDGSPAFRRLPSLEEAVRLVEHLRNVEGVSEVSCHTLTEVPLAFRAYYKVEVPSAAPQVADAPPQAEAEHPVLVAVPDQPLDQALDQAEPAAVPAVEAPLEAPLEAPVAAVAAPTEAPVPALAASNGHAPASPGRSSLGFFSR